jgi:hypothetical protein
MASTTEQSTQATTGHAWTGWYRASARASWRAVVQASTDREAWDRLLNHPERGDRCVLPHGQHPDQGKRR